jgi:hypothetical protein
MAALALCQGKFFILKGNLWAKTRAEYGIGGTEDALNLLSKKRKF